MSFTARTQHRNKLINNRVQRVAQVAMGWLLASTVSAALTTQDKTDLTASLQSLSSGWVQSDVDRANSIMGRSQYLQADWQDFFGGFFASNLMTADLQNYLQYPVLSWLDSGARKRLQEGLLPVLLTRFDTTINSNKANLGPYLQTNKPVRVSLVFGNRLINQILNAGAIDSSVQVQTYNFYLQQFANYPQLWKSSVNIDVQAQPYVAHLRNHVMSNLVESVPLTSERKATMAQAMGLSGVYQQVWDKYSTLLSDNNCLDSAQLNRVDTYSGSMTGLYRIGLLSVVDCFGTLDGEYPQYWLIARYGSNIAADKIGSYGQNPFPSDVPAIQDDYFGSVLAHEINHQVDALTVDGVPANKARRDQLLQQAGAPHLNYLRSILDDGTFQKAPQEFFASISNQWFVSTPNTFELALTRWENGYKEPINQFLFFGKIHARGSNQMPFYVMDAAAALSMTAIPVQYDANGNVNKLTVNNKDYLFTLDASGNVTEMTNARPHTLGGTVSGLTASGLVLQNGSDTVSIASGATSFVFGSKINQGAGYGVTVKTQPAGQSCSLSNAGGTMGSANIANLQVSCSFVCSEVTDTNNNHTTAGRAYTKTSGTWITTTTWYAYGSNDSLGTSGSTSVKLAQTKAGYYVKGSCPAAPTVGTPGAVVNGGSVTVSGSAADANSNLSKVEVEFDGNGAWLAASGTTSWNITKTDLPIGSHTVRARATDTTGLVSASSAAVGFTTTNAPVCVTAKNTDHITAGRAHACGTTYSPQACANGSNNNLGSSSSYLPATSSIKQTGVNYWVKVSSCS